MFGDSPFFVLRYNQILKSLGVVEVRLRDKIFVKLSEPSLWFQTDFKKSPLQSLRLQYKCILPSDNRLGVKNLQYG